MILRLAEARDVPFICTAVRELAAKDYQQDKCNPSHIYDVIETAIESPTSLVAVMDDEDKFAGCFMGTIGQNLLSGSLTCAEVFFWVEPRYRGHGKKLLKFAENWARSKDCKTFALSAPQSAVRANMVFSKWGFTTSEVWYRKAL